MPGQDQLHALLQWPTFPFSSPTQMRLTPRALPTPRANPTSASTPSSAQAAKSNADGPSFNLPWVASKEGEISWQWPGAGNGEGVSPLERRGQKKGTSPFQWPGSKERDEQGSTPTRTLDDTEGTFPFQGPGNKDGDYPLQWSGDCSKRGEDGLWEMPIPNPQGIFTESPVCSGVVSHNTDTDSTEFDESHRSDFAAGHSSTDAGTGIVARVLDISTESRDESTVSDSGSMYPPSGSKRRNKEGIGSPGQGHVQWMSGVHLDSSASIVDSFVAGLRADRGGGQ